MGKKDPDKYIENLEEIIISKDRLIEKLRRSANFTDITLSVLPHISLLNHWIVCASEELYGNTLSTGKVMDEPGGNHEKNTSKGGTYENLLKDIKRYAFIAKTLSQITLQGKWCDERALVPGDLNDTIILWSKRFNEHPSRKEPIHLKLSLERAVPRVTMSETGLFRIINSIASNSIEALSGRENPVIIIRTKVLRNKALLEIEDNGPGIQEGVSSKILAPYFTTKSNRPGPLHHGLGLHSVAKILDTMGGKLEFESSPDFSTVFRITLPISQRDDKLLDLSERGQKDIRHT